MKTLKFGDKGNDVKALQKRLIELGFRPGTPDGIFGYNTTWAVQSFQRSRRLLVDGVAGPVTLRELGIIEDDQFNSSRSVIDKVTVEIVSQMFPGTPSNNIKKHLPFVLKALEEEELFDKDMVLMALATIRAETAGFLPIDEMVSRYNTEPPGPPFNKYDYRADLGNTGPPDGEQFKGRGFIQLTGRNNYLRYGQKIGVDNKLVENPDLANSPQIAAQILASFIKDKELKIREALQEGRLDIARRYVNGGTHGLPQFVKAFNTGDELI